MTGLLFIVSAPAGTGKTTLVDMLTKEFAHIVRSISYTTRDPRPGEKNGKDYFFITEKQFEEKREDFLEYAKVFNHHYGTSKSQIEKHLKEGKHVVLVIDTQGAFNVMKQMKAVSIFISPPNLDVLKERLKIRGTETEDQMNERLSWARNEMDQATYYHYQIVNEDLKKAYIELKKIVLEEEQKVKNGEKNTHK